MFLIIDLKKGLTNQTPSLTGAKGETSKLSMAAALDPSVETDAAIAAALAATIDDAGPIDENLFDGDDLDELDEDLEQLTL